MSHKKIHHLLKKHYHATRKARRLFYFKYPKLFLFLIFIFASYYIFSRPEIYDLMHKLNSFSYVGVFIAGLLLAFGFSAPFGLGFLLVANPNNIFLASLIGGAGAAVGDLVIFKMIKFSFMNEFAKLKKAKIVRKIKEIIHSNHYSLIKHYLLYVFAGIIMASLVPDEIGVSMLAGLTVIKASKLAVIGFALHTIAIFLVLYLRVVL